MVYASSMNGRHAFLIGLGLVWSASSAFLACGSGSSGGDGGTDASTDNATRFDVPMSEQKNHTDSPLTDSPTDGGGDVVAMDAGLTGHCSRVNGPACDIVLQNCPSGHECVVVNDPTAESGLGQITSCQPTQSSEHLPAGSACCPGPNNSCNAGLTCVGSNCVGDAGGGQCTPACCPGDGGTVQANCGSSPVGYIGTCNLDLTIADGSVLYTTCIYASSCTVFAQPCGATYTCSVENKSGTSKCVQIYNPDGGPNGLPAGAGCSSANSCEQGTNCISFISPDGGAGPYTCTYLCYIAGGSPPFDAGILTGKPGAGGCPSGQTCNPDTMNLPAWLGLCGP
jgi:hypothetical protein